MSRTVIAFAALLCTARLAVAQNVFANAKAKAANAAAAENAHIEAEQHPEPQGKSAAKVPTSQAATSKSTKSASRAAPSAPSGTQVKHDTIPPKSILREEFEYSSNGRRDPFVSLLTTDELRPAMSDLRLTGILYDHSGAHSVATFRDLVSNAQYRVTRGSTLGRMRVAAIRPKAVIFTIEEFGTTRQDSLVLGDSTKARPK